MQEGLQAVDGGRMWLDGELREPLTRAGLDRFGAVMGTADGHCMRALADRENWRLVLHSSHASSDSDRGVYLKKHHVRTVATRLRARLGLGPGETAAWTEARNIGRLAGDGIDTMRLVAYGQQLHPDGLLESFVLTEELTGYEQLDHFLARRFPLRELHHTQSRGQADADLGELIGRVADVARRFHAAGYNHRDLYCCHFFIREPQPGRFDVRLIDLQRVQHRRRLRRRWIVKDLGQLAYSAPRDRVKCTHKMAFLRAYLGVNKLRPRDKRLVREVLAKQQLMEQKRGIVP
ncbi:MAG TPA: lipopolysaccharide kinase InaA family protein [Thermoguttaceae bacterium]|nr:lipopolysaccharide kinase InaA family protein [Thermoguttaceae bacterium]